MLPEAYRIGEAMIVALDDERRSFSREAVRPPRLSIARQVEFLLKGTNPAVLAREIGVAPSTVRRWVTGMKPNDINKATINSLYARRSGLRARRLRDMLKKRLTSVRVLLTGHMAFSDYIKEFDELPTIGTRNLRQPVDVLDIVNTRNVDAQVTTMINRIYHMNGHFTDDDGSPCTHCLIQLE